MTGGESAILLGLVNTLGILAKVIHDNQQKKKNGTPNGYLKALEGVKTDLKEEMAENRAALRRFSERVDLRDKNFTDVCTAMQQRLTAVETRIEMLHK